MRVADTPIYDKMVSRWPGETPDEIKEQYGMWPLIRKLDFEFKFAQDLRHKLEEAGWMLIRFPDPGPNDVVRIKCLVCGDMTFWPDWICSFCDGNVWRFGLYLPNYFVRRWTRK